MFRFEQSIPGVRFYLDHVSGGKKACTWPLKPGTYELQAHVTNVCEWPLTVGVRVGLSGPITRSVLRSVGNGIYGYTQRINVCHLQDSIQVGTPQCSLQMITVSGYGHGTLWDAALAAGTEDEPVLIITPTQEFRCHFQRNRLDCGALESKWPPLAEILRSMISPREGREFPRRYPSRSPSSSDSLHGAFAL